MNPFKGRHFQRDIILWAVRWYCNMALKLPSCGGDVIERGSGNCRFTHDFTTPVCAMRLKWKNGCAGTGVTLPIFARGTWMKPAA
ncbi:hypothetical protein F6P93_23275 (plasmid) [Escherichia coli]|nr:hypothetical protein F6P93_23275 [Escherichia coli]